VGSRYGPLKTLHRIRSTLFDRIVFQILEE